MLKISEIDDHHRRTLVLEGQLIAPWISVLEQSWNELRLSHAVTSIVIDLRDVTAISREGQQVLSRIMAQGAELKCYRGVLIKQVIRQLKQRCKAQSRKARIPNE